MSAEEHAREQARRLRLVLDECERVLHDRSASEQAREVARRWQRRLGGRGGDWAGYSSPISAPGYGSQRHHRSGGQGMHTDMVLDGSADR